MAKEKVVQCRFCHTFLSAVAMNTHKCEGLTEFRKIERARIQELIQKNRAQLAARARSND